MSNFKSYHWRIAGFYFFYYAFIGMFAPYWSLYLQSIHFDVIEISILLSIQPVMRMLAPGIWGWLADHTGKRLLVVQIAASLSALFYLGVFATTSFWGMFIVLMLMAFFWSASMPLVEATTLSYLGKNTAHYGRIRSWGSIGFIVSVVGLGFAFDYIAIAWLLWAGLVCEIGILIFSRQIPKTEVLAHHTDSQSIRQIVMQPRVLALFGACFLMSVAHGPYYTFYSIYLVEHGYAKSAVGGLWALGVICEIGVFFLMPQLVRRFGFVPVLLFSFAAAVLRFLLIGWAVDVLLLILVAQVLHAATFGAYHASSVGMVHEFFQGRHQSKGQALFGSVTYGAGGVLGGLASGPIWQHWGASALYSFSAGAALFGLALLLWHNRALYSGTAMSTKTLYDKLWDTHVVRQEADGTALIYIDRHLVHEVTSPQAFEGLKLAQRKPWRTGSMLAVPDHNVPTTKRSGGIVDPIARLQVETLDANCVEFGITEFKMNDVRQGIVHVIGPEQGATLPGMTVVCGDSHTSTHGAFAALAHGIGTSEVEHVMATQCLVAKKSKAMLVKVEGTLVQGVTAKDIALAVIGKIGTAGGTGFAIEFAGSAIRGLSMEGRMTLCNMAIEAGARAGMVAADDTTFAYFKGRPFAPQGAQWDAAVAYWRTLHSDAGAKFDATVELDAVQIKPQVTWGTSPEMVTDVNGRVPDPASAPDAVKRGDWERALVYMGLKANTPITDIKIDKVFIGSCTNGRIEDMRAAAAVAKGKKIAANVKLAMVVPGSGLVKHQAEQEGLDKIFIAAGFEWRDPGCSMCLAMNDDRLSPGERCAATSNRNFEGRQGQGGRTHLVSPAMAAAAAIAGHFVDVSQ